MAKQKDTPGMDHIVAALKANKTAAYADIRASAEKKGLTIYPIMYGRAQALLGIVKSAKRGTGKVAKASAAKAAGLPVVRRGPGRPRKNPLPVVAGLEGIQGIVDAVKSSQREVGRFRVALERIQGVVASALT